MPAAVNRSTYALPVPSIQELPPVQHFRYANNQQRSLNVTCHELSGCRGGGADLRMRSAEEVLFSLSNKLTFAKHQSTCNLVEQPSNRLKKQIPQPGEENSSYEVRS